MKKVIASFLSVILVVLAGCSKDDNPRVDYYEGAAMVKYSDTGEPQLEVLNGRLVIVPGLAGEGLEDGDLLLAGFYIEEEKQTKNDSIIASDFKYNEIDSSIAKPITGTASEYTFPIEGAAMWLNNVGNIWAFEFTQTAPEGQTFDYEMQYNKGANDSYPTVYIRSKVTNSVEGSDTKIATGFGFDLSPLIAEYADKTTGTLHINVKYLSGFDSDKKEIIASFEQNPIKLIISGENDDVEGAQTKAL